MILKFCKAQQKKFRLKPTQKPYLECVWSKPGNKNSVKYSLSPLCQVRDLAGLIKERWGCSRGCSLQVHCNTPSKLQFHSEEKAAISQFGTGTCTAMEACSSTQIWLGQSGHSGAWASHHSGNTPAFAKAQTELCSLWGKWDSWSRKLFSGPY